MESRTAGTPEVVDLVRRAQEGSAAAFALLYDHYVDDVYAYVYHRVGQRHVAEDLVGDVFLNALRRIGTFRWQGVDFRAWLFTIARNRCHDHFKSARFRLEAPVAEIFDRADTDDYRDPERAVLNGELVREVQQALGRLEGAQAEVLYLRFVRHLGVAESAEVMGKTDAAIKALTYRALKSLAKLLPKGIQAP